MKIIRCVIISQKKKCISTSPSSLKVDTCMATCLKLCASRFKTAHGAAFSQQLLAFAQKRDALIIAR